MIWKLGRLLACCTIGSAETPPPESIRFVTFSSSDVIGAWSNYILDLRPTDDDVLIRSIRVGPPNTVCSSPIVITSHERQVDQAKYKKLFDHANPCDVKAKAVQRAMRARGPVDLMEHPVDVKVVATCGGEIRTFDLPHLPRGRRPGNRKVARLRDLYWDIYQEVFPDDTRYRSFDPEEDFQLQVAAQRIMPDLEAGEFNYWIDAEDGGGWGGWKYAIDGYEGPVRTERLLVVELAPSELEFIQDAAPDYPPLAVAARIQGTVRLALDFALDGSVTEARLVDGHQMLAPSAIEAALSWRVDLQRATPTSAEVEVSFELVCGD